MSSFSPKSVRARVRRAFASWLTVPLTLVLLLATASAAEPNSVILATTTSTQDSGLLDVLVSIFEQKSGYTVKTVAVGTGQSLAMGDRGESDVVLVHAPSLELEYLAKGTLINRRLVMHNDFIVVGPANDPAGIRKLKSGAEALRAIANSSSPFVSRGDNSGTHNLERKLWKANGLEPKGAWYLESGQGMGQTLMIASQKNAYTISDRATYLAFSKRVELAIVLEGDPQLLNVYHVMEVNPERFPKVNAAGGKAFADFMVAPETQSRIGQFGTDKYGQPLFVPDAGKPEPGQPAPGGSH
jgi:tungstate transport system substrate-binding protein